MNKLFTYLILVLSWTSFGQDTLNYQWVEKGKYEIGKSSVWSVDALENVYISSKGEINKYDSIGTFKFTQSIKYLGRMTAMVPVNTMKLVHFSEEQQSLCFFDNTLTPTGDCIDLSEKEIINASLISRSNQPDKLWLFDNLNSSLVLMNVERESQQQRIDNLGGVINSSDVQQIAERSNQLFLLDENGVFIFDLYGSLISKFEIKGAIGIDAYEGSLFVLMKDEFRVYDIRTSDFVQLSLPKTSIQEFSYRNRSFYFKGEKFVHKFALQF